MTPESHNIPGWAHRERQADFAWVGENLHVFWTTAAAAFEDVGRGAIVVDTTVQSIPGPGNPFAYASQKQVEEGGDEDARRMVAGYDPARELVLVLLKSGNRISTYRAMALPPEPQETVTSEATPGYTGGPAAEPKLEWTASLKSILRPVDQSQVWHPRKLSCVVRH